MTSRIRTARLVGWVRLLPDRDGYGIPLFKGRGNAPLTPETDDDLVITRFHEFYNEASYGVSHALPAAHEGRKYRAGDKVPIPVSLGGQVEVIDASRSAAEFLGSHGDMQGSPTVQAVAAILAATASGAYRRATAERVVRRFRLEHDEVLAGEPTHSAYWVEKLSQAAGAVRHMAKSDQPAGRDVVAQRSTAWLRKFGLNSDPKMLGRLLKVAAQAGAPVDAASREAVFATLLDRFGEGTLVGKEAEGIIGLALPWMPRGLYGHYLQFGLPKELGGKNRDKVRDLPRFLMEVLEAEDHRSSSFAKSLALAGAIFANGDLPIEISGTIAQIASNRAKALKSRLSLSYYPTYRSFREPTRSEASVLLEEHNQVVALYRILHGEDRLFYNPVTGRIRYGLGEDEIDALRNATKQHEWGWEDGDGRTGKRGRRNRRSAS